MATSHVVEGQSRDVVSLTLTYQSVVFEKILELGLVLIGLGAEHLLGFGSEGMDMSV